MSCPFPRDACPFQPIEELAARLDQFRIARMVSVGADRKIRELEFGQKLRVHSDCSIRLRD
jgi:hypothetical protein